MARRLRWLVLAALVTVAVGAAPVQATALRNESFDQADWYRWWGMAARPFRTAVVKEDGQSFLRIRVPQGAHDGTSFFAPTGDADQAVLRYRLRIGTSFQPAASAFDVKLPGFGKPELGPDGSCIAGCGGSPTDGTTAYSARTDVNADGRPGFYVYDVNAARFGRGPRWSIPSLTTGVWHDIELHIAMNTPGVADGVLVARVDGQQVYEARDVAFRTSADLHVGAAWFNVYYGGTGVSPTTVDFDLDDVAITVS
jgi:hypothetical protein